MTHSQTRSTKLPKATAPGHGPAGTESRTSGKLVVLREGRELAIETGSDDILVLVRGVATIETQWPEFRHVQAILFPEGAIAGAGVPPSTFLCARTSVEVVRYDGRAVTSGAVPEFAMRLMRQVGLQQARNTVMETAIAKLNAQERLATLLFNLSLYIGARVPGGTMLEIPLSRTDLADHLGLNADTLSRTFSELKAKGLVDSVGRLKMVLPDLAALKQLSPLAATLEALARTSALVVEGELAQG